MNLILFLAVTQCWLIAQVLSSSEFNNDSSPPYRSGDWSCQPSRDANGTWFCDPTGPFYGGLLNAAEAANARNVFVGNIPPQDNGVQPSLPVGGTPGKLKFIQWCTPKANTDKAKLGRFYVQLLQKWATEGHHDGSVNTGGAIHDDAERTGFFSFTDIFFKITNVLAHILVDMHAPVSCYDIVKKTGGEKDIQLGYYYTLGPSSYNDPATSARDVSQSICKRLPCCLPILQRSKKDQQEWDTSFARYGWELQRLCSPRYVKNARTDCDLEGDIMCIGPYDNYPQAYNGKPDSPASCNCMTASSSDRDNTQFGGRGGACAQVMLDSFKDDHGQPADIFYRAAFVATNHYQAHPKLYDQYPPGYCGPLYDLFTQQFYFKIVHSCDNGACRISRAATADGKPITPFFPPVTAKQPTNFDVFFWAGGRW